MEKNNDVYLVLGGIAIAVIAGLLGYNSGKNSGAQEMHMNMAEAKPAVTPGNDHSQMTMTEMTKGLDGLTGDAFDKAFVEMMIAHHQGAVDMAKRIPANAKHIELKKLGEDIISAQTKEIEMMEGWLKSWGYKNEGGMMMDHSKMMQ